LGLTDPTKSLRVPARVCATPTNLGIAFPHGGADLGHVANIIFLPNLQAREVDAEEFGGTAVEWIVAGERPLLALNVRGFTDAMVTRVFRETFTGGGGDEGIRYNTTRGGDLISAQAFKLLVSPRDTINHPGLIIYRACPIIEETAEVPLGTRREIGLRVFFHAIKDATKGHYEIQKLADMTL